MGNNPTPQQEAEEQADPEFQEALRYIGIISYLAYLNNPGNEKEVREFVTKTRNNRSKLAITATTVIQSIKKTTPELTQTIFDRIKIYWITCLIYYLNPGVDHTGFLIATAKSKRALEVMIETSERMSPAISKGISPLQNEDLYHFFIMDKLKTTWEGKAASEH